MKTLALFLILFFQGIEALPKRSQKPSIIEKPFDVTYNAMKLRNALKIQNEAMVVRIVCDKTYNQRLQIRDKYTSLYNETLKFDFGGDFGELLDMLFTDWLSWRVKTLHKSLRDYTLVYTKEDFVELILSHGQDGIEELRQRYRNATGGNLHYGKRWPEYDQYKDPYYEFLINGNRSENVSLEEATKDAKKLYDSPLDNLQKWHIFIVIYTTRSFAQLDLMYDEFQRMYGVELENLILKFFPNRPLVDILKMIRNSGVFYVPLLKRTMEGILTDEWRLSYYIVTRAEIDLKSIKEEWDRMEEESLYDWIMDDTSGYFREALLAILEGNNYD